MTHETWRLEDATKRFDEVVEKALTEGPQVITWHGMDTAVVVSFAGFWQPQLAQKKLSEFFRDSPLVDAQLDLSRDKTPPSNPH